MQRPQRYPTSVDKCVMLAQQHFDGFNPEAARNHLVAFKKYDALQTRQGSINTFD